MDDERKSAHAAHEQVALVSGNLEARTKFLKERIDGFKNEAQAHELIAEDTQDQLDKLSETHLQSYQRNPKWLALTVGLEHHADKAERYRERAKLYQAELDKLLRATKDQDGSDGTDKSTANSKSGSGEASTMLPSSIVPTNGTKDSY